MPITCGRRWRCCLALSRRQVHFRRRWPFGRRRYRCISEVEPQEYVHYGNNNRLVIGQYNVIRSFSNTRSREQFKMEEIVMQISNDKIRNISREFVVFSGHGASR